MPLAILALPSIQGDVQIQMRMPHCPLNSTHRSSGMNCKVLPGKLLRVIARPGNQLPMPRCLVGTHLEGRMILTCQEHQHRRLLLSRIPQQACLGALTILAFPCTMSGV